MKNLKEQSVCNELISRIDKLAPGSKPLWGKMNATQALRHMTMAVLTATGDTKLAPVKSPLPHFLMKILLLNMKPPKEMVRAFKEINMVANNIMPEDFEAERTSLKTAIQKVSESASLAAANPMGIKFNNSDWGKLMYNHTDHHLRQFGV